MRSKRHRVVVVEDSDVDFECFVRAIQAFKDEVEVMRFVDGGDAIRYFQKLEESGAKKPRLVLLDLNLPGFGGSEVLVAIRKHDPFVPIVIFSTSTHESDLRNCMEKGANAYVAKPMSFDDLKRAARAICEFWLRANVRIES